MIAIIFKFFIEENYTSIKKKIKGKDKKKKRILNAQSYHNT